MPVSWVVVYSAIRSVPPSRPSPDCLTPSDGAAAFGDDLGVESDHAKLDLFGHAQKPVEVAAAHVGVELDQSVEVLKIVPGALRSRGDPITAPGLTESIIQ